MHDLVVRNQDGTLTAAENEQMLAVGKATTVLFFLKSKAAERSGSISKHDVRFDPIWHATLRRLIGQRSKGRCL